MPRLVLLFACALLVGPLVCLAQHPEDDEADRERPTQELVEQLADRVTERTRDWVDERLRDLQSWRHEALEQSVTLTFELREGDRIAGQPLTVTTATPAFRAEVMRHRDDELFIFSIRGTVEPLGDWEYLVVYEAEIGAEDAEGETHVELGGSARLRSNVQRVLADTAGHRLVASLSFQED